MRVGFVGARRMGEAFALARRAREDSARFLELLTGTLFAAPTYRTYGAMIAADAYEPAGLAPALDLVRQRRG